MIMSQSGHISLQLLGSFSATVDGQAAMLRRKTRALVAYLATMGQPQTRRKLMALFCQEANAPSRALAVLLSRVRKQLGAAVLHTEGEMVALNFAAVTVDVAHFLAVLEDRGQAPGVAGLETAVSLYRAEFLAGLTLDDAPEFEQWLLGQQARFHHLQERGLSQLIDGLMAQHELAAALPHAQRLVAHTPLLEEGHARLMALYAQLGQREAALRQFEHCQAVLQAELAVAPTPALAQLKAQIEAGTLHAPKMKKVAQLAVTTAVSIADFVGRTAEMRQLQATWQLASVGQGQLLVVSAPAGGGKSRLLDQFCQTIQPVTVYRGTCYESTQALPYQPWLAILEAHLQQLDDAALQALPPATQTYLSRLLPALARRLPTAGGDSQNLVEEPQRLFTAVVDFLSQSATGQPAPCVLLLDDLQWADETSLRLLHYVGQRLARFPWLVVAAYRSEEAVEQPALSLLLAEFARQGVSHLGLNPLTQREIEQLASYLWPRLAPGYRPHVAAMLAAASGGNALFVTAVLQELASADQVPSDLPVPASVQALMQRRLQRLSPGARQVLEALAVLDGGGTLRQLQQICARSVEETEQALEWGMQWGMVDANAAPAGTRYQFQHDLVREAVYGTLTAVRQQRLHRRTAVWLAQRAERQPVSRQQEAAETILYHARQGEAFDLVFYWARLAADHHRHIFAYQEMLRALDMMRAAYEPFQMMPNFDPAVAELALFESLLWWLSFSWVTGRSAEDTLANFEMAQTLLARYPSAKRAAQLQLLKAPFQLSHEEAIPVLREVHTQFLQLEEPIFAARALVMAASASITMSQNRNGRSLYEQALSLYQQARDEAGEVQCLSGLAWTALNLGETAVALAHLQQALAISQRQGDKLGEAQARFGLAAAWGFYHAPAQMQVMAEAAEALYLQIGFQGRTIRPLLYLGAAHDVRGDFTSALTVYEAALTQTRTFEDSWVEGWLRQLIGRIHLRHGELALAETYLRQAQQLRLASGERQNQLSDLAWLARLHLLRGEPETAVALTADVMAGLALFHGEFYVWEQPDLFMCRAEALAATGQLAAAQVALQQGHECLHNYAQQIDDPQVRTQFLAYSLNARLETAVATGIIPTWPDA
ncbi:MAG: AAA family ATPase [Chloroflexota bacterium]